jgi:hypothetical protein
MDERVAYSSASAFVTASVEMDLNCGSDPVVISEFPQPEASSPVSTTTIKSLRSIATPFEKNPVVAQNTWL